MPDRLTETSPVQKINLVRGAGRQLISRRQMIGGSAALSVITAQKGFAAPSAARGRKFVLIILRGGMDGLAAVPYYGDDIILGHRPGLLTRQPHPLDDGFALHRSLRRFHRMYQDGDAAVVHAVAGPYRDRSHFHAQDLLETGRTRSLPVNPTGWLNLVLRFAPIPLTAVAIGVGTPLVLRGSDAVPSWSPPILPEADMPTTRRLLRLYGADPVLGDALQEAVDIGMIAPDSGEGNVGRIGADDTNLVAAGTLLAAAGGPDIAVVSLGGWDTHAGQAPALEERFATFDTGLFELKRALGPTWDNTICCVVSEFGRSVRQNGTEGSDHGTAGAALLLGGRVRGGRIIGDWPGIRDGDLFEGRDLRPANNMNDLFAAILERQFGFSVHSLRRRIFSDSSPEPMMRI